MEPEKTLNEKAAIQRAAIAHRARWMALLFEELERDGMPADRIEQIMRRAVRRCGKMDGQAYRDAASDPASVKEIIQTRFANEMGQASFAKRHHSHRGSRHGALLLLPVGGCLAENGAAPGSY